MNKINIGYYKNVNEQFKTSLNCFNLFENRIIEGVVFQYSDFAVIDVGFKHLIKIDLPSKLSNTLILKIIEFDNLFNDLNINYMELKNDLNYRFTWSILKKAFQYKCFLIGKVLNPVRNGFSIGICGFVGFIPKRYFTNNHNKTSSVFIISHIDLIKKTFVLSQKQINKITARTLFKLSSQIIYVSKN